MTQTETRKVPAEALRFSAGPCEFGQAADGSRNVPVRITARSGQPVDHWYWGKIVHDLKGMRLHKRTLPIDYAHYDDEVLGFLDKFETDSGALVVSGEIVPFGPVDRAAEVVHKAQNKVPYEASIFFSGPLKLEELAEGTEAEVNGYKLAGPALIVRQWNLRGVAICPYGMDRNTKTQLKAGDEVPVEILSEEKTTMADQPHSKPQDETAPDPTQAGQLAEPAQAKTTPPPLPTAQAAGREKPEGGQQTAAATPPADPRAEAKKFVEAFGAQGATWFAEGKSFEEARQLQLAALKTENEGLKTRLAQVGGGEKEPLSFQAAEPDKTAKTTQFKNLPDGLARFAAGIKFAGAAK